MEALETAKEKFRDSNGLTKLPGTIIGGFTKAEAQAVKKAGWIKRIGSRYVVTQKGYQES